MGVEWVGTGDEKPDPKPRPQDKPKKKKPKKNWRRLLGGRTGEQ